MAAILLTMRRHFQTHYIRITIGFSIQKVTPNDQIDPFVEVPAGLRELDHAYVCHQNQSVNKQAPSVEADLFQYFSLNKLFVFRLCIRLTFYRKPLLSVEIS